MRDQYGNEVPDDLVVLDLEPSELLSCELKKVGLADWYKVDGVILVSYRAVDGLTETDPVDAGIELNQSTEILYINQVLHRWNGSDGFYHA